MRVSVDVYQDKDPMGSGQWFAACYAVRPSGERVWIQDRLACPQPTQERMVAAARFGYSDAEVQIVDEP